MDKAERDRLWFEIKEHEAAGTLAQALNLCLAAVKAYPADSNFHGMLGACYFFRNDFRAAVAAQEEAIRLEPKNYSAYLYLGLACLHLRQYDKALEAYTKAAHLSPTDSVPQIGIGDVHYYYRDRDSAITAFKRAVELDSASASAQFGLAKTYNIFGGIDAALIHFEAGLKIEPNITAEVYAGLATIYAAKHDQDASMREYLEAYRLDPVNKEIRKRFAQALLLAGRIKDALRVKAGLPLEK